MGSRRSASLYETPCGCQYRHGLRIVMCQLHAVEAAQRYTQREVEQRGEVAKLGEST